LHSFYWTREFACSGESRARQPRGSAGIGLETARRACIEGAELILTGRNPERLESAASELGALSNAAFDATDQKMADLAERSWLGQGSPQRSKINHFSWGME